MASKAPARTDNWPVCGRHREEDAPCHSHQKSVCPILTVNDDVEFLETKETPRLGQR